MATALDVISLQEAKDYLKVDFADEDALITRAVKTAVALVEQHTQHYLYTREIVQQVRSKHAIYAYPFTVTSLGSDVAYTLTPYTLYSVLCFDTGAVEELTLSVGYATKTDIPEPLADACFRLIAYRYENREAQQAIIPSDVYQQLQPYRRDASL